MNTPIPSTKPSALPVQTALPEQLGRRWSSYTQVWCAVCSHWMTCIPCSYKENGCKTKKCTEQFNIQRCLAISHSSSCSYLGLNALPLLWKPTEPRSHCCRTRCHTVAQTLPWDKRCSWSKPVFAPSWAFNSFIHYQLLSPVKHLCLWPVQKSAQQVLPSPAWRIHTLPEEMTSARPITTLRYAQRTSNWEGGWGIRTKYWKKQKREPPGGREDCIKRQWNNRMRNSACAHSNISASGIGSLKTNTESMFHIPESTHYNEQKLDPSKLDKPLREQSLF